MKGDSYGAPDRYLGANVEKYQLNDGKIYQSMHAADYLNKSCKMVRKWSEDKNRRWNKKQEVAMIQKYQPEIDISDELGDVLATRFQQMIGILRWSVELGRIVIITE